MKVAWYLPSRWPRPVWVRAYVDERNLDQAQPGRKVLLYTGDRPDQRITGRLVSFRRLLNLPRKPSKHRICVPDPPVYRLRIVVTDADDARYARCGNGDLVVTRRTSLMPLSRERPGKTLSGHGQARRRRSTAFRRLCDRAGWWDGAGKP